MRDTPEVPLSASKTLVEFSGTLHPMRARVGGLSFLALWHTSQIVSSSERLVGGIAVNHTMEEVVWEYCRTPIENH